MIVIWKSSFVNFLLLLSLVSFVLIACDDNSTEPIESIKYESSSSVMSDDDFAAECYEKYGIKKDNSWTKSISDNNYINEVVCEETSKYMNLMSPTFTRCTKANYSNSKNRFDITLITENGEKFIWASLSKCKYKLGSDGDFAGTVSYSGEWTLDKCLCKENEGSVEYRDFTKETKDIAGLSSEQVSSSSKEGLADDLNTAEPESSSSEEKLDESSSSSEAEPPSSDAKEIFKDDYFSEEGINFVKIGEQSWMEKNMQSFSNIDKGFLSCYGGENSMCSKYGTMTSWKAFTGTWSWFNGYDGPLLIANPVKGACPSGTHLPTKAELEELISYLEEYPDELIKINNQLGGVYGEGYPDDDAYYDDDKIESLLRYHGAEESFVLMGGELSETPDPTSTTLGVWSLHYSEITGMTLIKTGVGRVAYVRCIKNEGPEPETKPDTLTFAQGCEEAYRETWDYLNPDVEYGCIKDERDGRFYKTVVIQDKLWFAENLRFVPKESSWCYTTLDDGECDIYGRYYSGSAVRSLSGICPDGFHVASSSEFDKMSEFDHFELLSVDGWDQYDFTALGSNAIGFTILPNGCRGGNEPERGWTLGEFSGIGGIAYFWTRNQNGISEHYYAAMDNRKSTKNFSSSHKYNDFGMPVRCVKN